MAHNEARGSHGRLGPDVGVYLRVTVTRGRNTLMGPGKMRLLELIGQTGSIAAAARQMRMSYRRAWLLLHTTEAGWRRPLVSRAAGGRGGGGAQLTPFGQRVLETYRKVERRLGSHVRTVEQEVRRLLP